MANAIDRSKDETYYKRGLECRHCGERTTTSEWLTGSKAMARWWELLKLRYGSVNMRSSAAFRLTEAPDLQAAKHLAKALKDRSAEVRENAARALEAAACYWPALAESGQIFGKDRSLVISSLIEAIQDEEPVIYEKAVIALGMLHSEQALIRVGRPAVRPLIQMLGAEDEGVRRLAARLLAAIGVDLAMTGPLVLMLREEDKVIRGLAAKALVAIGSGSAEPLIELLTSPDEFVRDEAQEALAQVLADDSASLEPLISGLRSHRKSVREGAKRALLRIGYPCMAVLTKALRNRSCWTRKAAAGLLCQMHWQPPNDVDKAYLFLARQQFREMVTLGDPAVEPLVWALQDHVPGIRESAASALEALGWIPSSARERAVLATAGGNWQDAVAEGPDAVDLLVQATKACDTSAAVALGQIRDVRAVRALTSALYDDHSDVRRAAEEALTAIGTSDALEAVQAWQVQREREAEARQAQHERQAHRRRALSEAALAAWSLEVTAAGMSSGIGLIVNGWHEGVRPRVGESVRVAGKTKAHIGRIQDVASRRDIHRKIVEMGASVEVLGGRDTLDRKYSLVLSGLSVEDVMMPGTVLISVERRRS